LSPVDTEGIDSGKTLPVKNSRVTPLALDPGVPWSITVSSFQAQFLRLFEVGDSGLIQLRGVAERPICIVNTGASKKEAVTQAQDPLLLSRGSCVFAVLKKVCQPHGSRLLKE
jgi:hypothetical protein